MNKNFSKYLVIFSLYFSVFNLHASSSENTKQMERSSPFTTIAQKAEPAVVFIKSKSKRHVNSDSFGSNDPFGLFNDEFLKRFFGGPPTRGRPEPETQSSEGSGFIVSSDGYILTNYHVIKEADEITVLLNDGREFKASVSGMDPRTDLAVLKIEAKDLPYLILGDSDHLKLAEDVIAIGNPFGLQSSVSKGIVSAKGRQDLGINSLEDFIQTDAAINPGNSGGPLLNLNGEVIGINTVIITRSGGYMGIGFAIPSNMAKHVFDQIINTGIIKRAYLGIMLQQIDKDLAEALSLDKNTEGVLISEVVKDSPAEKGGLKHGDIIVSLDGKLIKSVNKFRNKIALMNPGTAVKLHILRNGKTHNMSIKLGTLSEKEVSSTEFFHRLGIDVDNIVHQSDEIRAKLGYDTTQEGALITKVESGSPAALAGLKPYYLITGVVIDWKNQIKVKDTSDLTKALREVSGKKYVVLIVKHQSYQRYYTLKVQ